LWWREGRDFEVRGEHEWENSSPFAKGSINICGLNVYTDLAFIRPTLENTPSLARSEVDTVEKEEVA